MTVHDYLNLLVGPSGRYLSALWDADEILANLFPQAGIRVSKKVAVQMINGQKRFPAKYVQPYLDAKDCDMITNNLREVISHYHSVAMLQDIMVRMRLAVAASGWPLEQIEMLNRYYITDNPSGNDIAVYLADVLHHVMYSQYLSRHPA